METGNQDGYHFILTGNYYVNEFGVLCRKEGKEYSRKDQVFDGVKEGNKILSLTNTRRK